MPVSRRQLQFERLFGSAASGLYGTAVPGVIVTATQSGGFFTAAFRTPLDMDRSRPSRLWLPIYNPGGVGPAAGQVELVAVITTGDNAAVAVNTTLTNVVTVSAAWPAGECRYIELLSGPNEAFPGGFFNVGDLTGLRFSRNGPAAADTWAATLGLITAPWLEYSQDCRWCVC